MKKYTWKLAVFSVDYIITLVTGPNARCACVCANCKESLFSVLSSHILTLTPLLSSSKGNLHAKVPLLAHWSPEINNRIVKYTQGWFIELSETLKKITDVLIWSRLCRACASVSNMKATVWKILLKEAAARKPIICFSNKDLSAHINIRYSGEQSYCSEWSQNRS